MRGAETFGQLCRGGDYEIGHDDGEGTKNGFLETGDEGD
jgi:hypothetical protein